MSKKRLLGSCKFRQPVFCSTSIQNGITTFPGYKKSHKSDYGSYPEQGIGKAGMTQVMKSTLLKWISIKVQALSKPNSKNANNPMRTRAKKKKKRTDISLKRIHMWQISI